MGSEEILCDLCNVPLPSLKLLSAHNEGKKHQKKLEKKKALEMLAKRSIYVCGVPKNTFTSHDEVESIFSTFGTVEKVHIDVTRGNFAIVEFENDGQAAAAIQQGTITVGEHVAVIKLRKVDFDDSQEKYEKETVDVDLVINKIEQCGGSFVEQVDYLAKLFCLSDEQINERLEFGKKLTTALSNYFTPGTYVCLFGSSITSVGTVDSDIDATILFGESALENEVVSDFGRNKYTLMTCHVDSLKGRKVQRSELARLNPADRVRLLSKIMNDIRRHNLAHISHLCLVLDARCPLLRFVFERNAIIDLSVDNRLGFAKTSWLAETIMSDASFTLRRFLVAVRFWALTHDLLRKDTTTGSCFNAYTLNILCLFFLQTKGVLPPLQRGPVPTKINKWLIDFCVQPVYLENIQLSVLIKEFFIWFALLKTRDYVLCPRLGFLLTFEEFQDAFPDLDNQLFKFAHLNIQDPIELSHNISQLVSEKKVAAMRRAMGYSVSSLRKKPESLVGILRCFNSDEGSSTGLEISLSATHSSCKDCAEHISEILTTFLDFQPVYEPCAKRAQHGDSNCTVIDFQIKSRLWLGRRTKRRMIAKENPNLNEWHIEELVTKKLRDGLEETENLLLRISFYLENNRLTLVLQKLAGGMETDVHNIGHFLSFFLTKKCFLANNQNDTLMEL